MIITAAFLAGLYEIGPDMQLKDSMTGELANVPSGCISIYACGITPYSSAHVGHARTYAVFDLLASALSVQGQNVRLVRNITDIDDKIIAAAKTAGVTWQDLGNKYSAENRQLMRRTGIKVPEEPKASDFLPAIFFIISDLLEKGHAYISPTGDVLYRVSSFKGPLLMKHKEGSLRSDQGDSRVSHDGKEDLRDFALWKLVDYAEPGFASPWGYGRPGWHVECSAMIYALFDGSVTIHGGGVDLKFPHHQAEIMQSEPVVGRPLADIWMHNGSVLSDGQKMSKSLNNFVTWEEALRQADTRVPGLGGDLLRLSLLQAHWQKPLDWASRLLDQTKTDLLQLTSKLEGVTPKPEDLHPFLEQLNANLNTPAAFVWLKMKAKAGESSLVAAALQFLGVDVQRWAAIPRSASVSMSPEEVAQLQAERNEARLAKNWPLADSIRLRLVTAGVSVKDSVA